MSEAVQQRARDRRDMAREREQRTRARAEKSRAEGERLVAEFHETHAAVQARLADMAEQARRTDVAAEGDALGEDTATSAPP